MKKYLSKKRFSMQKTLLHNLWLLFSTCHCKEVSIFPIASFSTVTFNMAYNLTKNLNMKRVISPEFPFIKQKVKSNRMAHYFHRDYEVHIWWTLYYPIKPWERSCEWHWSDATYVKGSVKRHNWCWISHNISNVTVCNFGHTWGPLATVKFHWSKIMYFT